MQPITLYNAEFAQDKLSSLAMVQLSSSLTLTSNHFTILNNYDWNEMNCFILLLLQEFFNLSSKRYQFFSGQFSEVHPLNVVCAKH